MFQLPRGRSRAVRRARADTGSVKIDIQIWGLREQFEVRTHPWVSFEACDKQVTSYPYDRFFGEGLVDSGGCGVVVHYLSG